jgi:hypothetical protein
MVVLTPVTIILQVRSIPAMTMVFATAPLGVPISPAPRTERRHHGSPADFVSRVAASG